MKEWKRVFGARLLVFLALILLLNLVLFLREQQTQGYGFAASGTDASRVQESYVSLLGEYRGRNDYRQVADEVRALADLETAYDQIRSLLQLHDTLSQSEKGRETWSSLFQPQYNALEERFPELVTAIAGGLELDEGELAVQSSAASFLADQLEYLAGYEEYLEQIQENREKLSSFSIFNQSESFTSRNIEKTADDFAVLNGVSPSLGEDRAISAFFSFELTDYFLVLSLVLITLSFLTERRRGLWNMVYATRDGRLRLAGRRLCILGVFSCIITVLLYGSTFLASLLVYGGWEDLGRPVQSIVLFQTLPIATSLGGLLLRYALLRALTAWLLGLLLWLFFSASSHGMRFSLILAAALFAVEYAFYTYLPAQSLWNVLKYFNVFAYIDLSSLYTRYLNLNIFGWPVNIRTLAAFACIPLMALAGGGCLCVQCFKRPCQSREPFGKAVNCVRRLTAKPIGRLHLLGYEGYKLLILQGGIFVFAAFCYLVFRVDFSTPIIKTQTDLFALQWQGELCEGTWEQINTERAKLEEGIKTYQQARERYQAGTLDAMEYYDIINLHGSDEVSLSNLEQVANTVRTLEDRGGELGTTLWLLCETPFQEVWGVDAQNNRIEWNLLVLFALALLIPGVITTEQSTDSLQKLIRATPRGRGILLRRKFLLTILTSTAVWLIPNLLELQKLLTGGMEFTTLNAPVQSLTFLIDFPFPLSIRSFMLVLYLFRWTVLTGVAVMILCLSALACKHEQAVLLSLAVFVLPGILWQYLNLNVARGVSVVRLSDFLSLLLDNCGSTATTLPVYVAFLWLTAGSLILLYRRLGKTD